MILLTRPYEDSVLTAEILAKDNIPTHIDPMIRVELRKDAVKDYEAALNGVDALIVTSANALKAIKTAKKNQFDLPIYTVGTATAEKARLMGFKQVHYGGEDANALSATLRLTFEDKGAVTRLLYPSGYVVSHDMAATLEASGVKVERVILYDTFETEQLSQETLELIDERRIISAMFYSTRSAEIFVKLVRKHGIEGHMNGVEALAMSQRVAGMLSVFTWASIRVAERPTQISMLSLAS